MKIAICFPALNGTTTGFALSLAALTYYTVRRRPDIELDIINRTSSILPKAREDMTDLALDRGFDAILMVDADMSFAPDALVTLEERGLDAVGANYSRKAWPHTPTAVGLDGGPVITHQARQAVPPEPVGYLGLGFFLARADALRKIARPMFNFFAGPQGQWLGEDHWFCDRLKDAGVPVHVDHAVSVVIGHAGERTVTHDDTLRALAARAVRS